MKLNKQPGAKLALVASALAMLGAFFALVRSQPHTEASVAPSASPAGNYTEFFYPTGTPSAGNHTQPSVPAPRPHTRTRGS